MKLLLITAIAIFKLSICDGVLLDYRLTYAPIKPANCTQGGLLCETCTSLVACIQYGKKWQKTPVAICTPPQKCINQQCSDDPDPVCDGVVNIPFKCTQTGTFPDPFFWDKYVMCVNTGTTNMPVLKGYSTDCDAGFYYNVQDGMCSLSEPKPGYPIDTCTKAGESKALIDNPILYYVCQSETIKKALYPQLYRCPGNLQYDNNNYACTPKK